MKYEIPNRENPFAQEDQTELAMAWELGWYKRDEAFREHIAETSGWAVHFRRAVREVLFPYYRSNPGSTDEELIEAINELVQKSKAD